MKFHLTNVCIIMVFLTIAGNLRKISALSCYMCIPNSLTDTSCNDPYPMLEKNLRVCSQNENHVCGKNRVHRFDDSVITMRMCTVNSTRTKQCDPRHYQGVSNVECSFCEEDGCNAAHGVTISPTTQYLIVVSIVISLTSFGILNL